MVNQLKKSLERGAGPLGTFLELGGCGVVECLARGGFDYLVVDSEHGPYSVEGAVNLIRASENAGITPLVRIGDCSRPSVLRMLDVGAAGLIVPNIHTPAQVRELVDHARFAPVGKRGYCPTRTSCWGADEWAADPGAYMERCNRETLLLPQCETRGAYEEIDDILAIDGVDGVFVGPCDLSIALGVPLQMDSPVLQTAIRHILERCKAAGKYAFLFTQDSAAARQWLDLGFDSITYNLDAAIFTGACREAVARCRG